MLQLDSPSQLLETPIAFRTGGETGFSRLEKNHPDRAFAERRIRDGYGIHFGASIDGFMPDMAIYRDRAGSSGIIGFRRASSGALFLENYLDTPIEAQIFAATGVQVSRNRLAEIGQFVIDDRDSVASFFRDLVPFLIEQRFDWACFTGTNRIRELLAKVGFHGLELAAATDQARLPPGDQWGSYYDNDPVVVVGKLSDPQGHWCRAMRRTSLRRNS